MSKLNRPTLERLMLYYHSVSTLGEEHPTSISSGQLAQLMDMDATQVRKDFAAVGLRGCPRVGFVTNEIKEKIRDMLGFDRVQKAVVVGAGRLGGALASYKEFRKYGLNIVALFDKDPTKVGLTVGHHVVQPMDRLDTFIRHQNVQLGIITVPADATQQVANALVAAGVKGIWNFSPASPTLPPELAYRHEHLSVGLAALSYRLKEAELAKPQDDPSSTQEQSGMATKTD